MSRTTLSIASHAHKKDAKTTTIPYNQIRNLTSPEEKENGVQTWFANVDARNVIDIGTEDNLRTYIGEHSSSRRTKVHREIENTILENQDRFISRNSGITITCTSCVVDDKAGVAHLQNASIINGAQTQGELKRYFSSLEEDDNTNFSVRLEIIMEPNYDQIIEVAIARNTATPVKDVSQAGARGYLDELKSKIEEDLPGETVQVNETDIEGIPAQALLQWCRVLMPAELEANKQKIRNKAYTGAGRCLKDFSDWAMNRKTDPEAKARYDFTIQIAAEAYKEYTYWQTHNLWNGHRLHENARGTDDGKAPKGGRVVRRGEDGKISWVAPGIIFPVLSAVSAFVVFKDGHWTIDKPDLFKPEQMIERAVQQFRSNGRQVAEMGRRESIYEALSIYTETIASVLKQQ